MLEFFEKAGVSHGDVSISNAMINQIFDHGPDDSPTKIRQLIRKLAEEAYAAAKRANTVVEADSASDAALNAEDGSASSLGVLTPIQPPSPMVGTAVASVPVNEPAAVPVPHIQSTTPAPAPARALEVVNSAGTLEFIESTGMLIDCDFMRYLYQDTHQTSVSGESIMLSNILLTLLRYPSWRLKP